ncbi:MAG TPA: ABC transporter permease, partial [Cyclobacteriaceae bacterium]|nr:ABC transporter permease [Cyclobacteriaceae bacterium]
SLKDEEQQARLGAVYNIFAFAAMIPLIFIIPRLTSSMHPGSGGNPGFNTYDLDSRMRMVFYPAVAGWILLGVWLASLKIRLSKIETQLNDEN